MKKYDFLIVGSGLYGAVFAREMSNIGKKCLVIDKRSHTGGNVFCEKVEDINVHKYGPHIFHTNDKKIWDYVNSYVEFNNFIYSPLANYKGDLYNLPFNMNTFYQLWNIKSPLEVLEKIKNQVEAAGFIKPSNLEEQAISMVGKEIYDAFIKGYTEKQWGRKAIDLPAFIIKRLPVRLTFDNNYFNDKYQGIPVGGYNKLIDGLLEGIEVETGVDFFENEYMNIPNYQGVSVMNFTDKAIPYTRIIEHKHFEFGKQTGTIVTKEYPQEWKPGMEAYYPINDAANNEKLKRYNELIKNEPNVIFGGRLAEYKYYDMHQVIASALTRVKKIKDTL